MSVEFVTPDHHKTNGFGREYIESQLLDMPPDVSLLELREELADLNEFLEPGFTKTIHASPWLEKSLAEVASTGIVAALTLKSGDRYVVNDLLFENVLQVNNYELARLSHEQRPEFDLLVGEFKERVIFLVENGVLPEVTTTTLDNLNDIKFVISEGYVPFDALGACERGE